MAFLAREGLKHRFIKSYLSCIRFAQITLSLGNPFANGAMPCLEYVLGGIKRVQAQNGVAPKPHLPVTINILQKLRVIWLQGNPHPNSIMLWAAACTGFFGFLRAGEFTVPSQQSYDPKIHLNISDIALDSHVCPSILRLRIKQSKTDPFHQGVDIYLGSTQRDVCPVSALINYIAICSACPGPLFIFQNGSYLTQAALVSHFQAPLQQAGFNHQDFNGHSFQIGAATTAAQCGMEDSLIQTLGR